MTDTTNDTAKKPAYIAYNVREREGKKARFTEIGVAFPHKDGKGFDILYDAIPTSGRITLRARNRNNQDQPGGQGCPSVTSLINHANYGELP